LCVPGDGSEVEVRAHVDVEHVVMSVLTSTGEDCSRCVASIEISWSSPVCSESLLAVEDEVDPAVSLLDHLAGFVDFRAEIMGAIAGHGLSVPMPGT
jgi:hypothetical protein